MGKKRKKVAALPPQLYLLSPSWAATNNESGLKSYSNYNDNSKHNANNKTVQAPKEVKTTILDTHRNTAQSAQREIRSNPPLPPPISSPLYLLSPAYSPATHAAPNTLQLSLTWTRARQKRRALRRTVDAPVVASACSSRDEARSSDGRTAWRAPCESAPCATGIKACPRRSGTYTFVPTGQQKK